MAHYLALAAVEPLLADEALILIDDATWPVVQNAHAAYIKNNPEWSIVATWDARFDNDPRWSNGLHALAFKRTQPSKLSTKDETLRRYQVGLQNRLNKLGWKLAGMFPKTMKFAAGLVMSRGHTIELNTRNCEGPKTGVRRTSHQRHPPPWGHANNGNTDASKCENDAIGPQERFSAPRGLHSGNHQ